MLDLPKSHERIGLIKKFLPNQNFDQKSLEKFVEITENFTGDEIRIACKELKMIEIRKSISKNFGIKISIDYDDAIAAFQQIKPVAVNVIQKYRDWSKNFDKF